VKIAKSSGPGWTGETVLSNPPQKINMAKGVPGLISALSASSSFILLFSIPGGLKGKEESISIERFVFFVFT
jgi:hypothetical protein